MGGKNPVIVAASADLDLAVEGVARSAFGLGGQKCSAASRAYVDASVVEEFCDRLARRAGEIRAGRPAAARRLPVAGRRRCRGRALRVVGGRGAHGSARW